MQKFSKKLLLASTIVSVVTPLASISYTFNDKKTISIAKMQSRSFEHASDVSSIVNSEFDKFMDWIIKNKSEIILQFYKILDPSSNYSLKYVLSLNENFSRHLLHELIDYDKAQPNGWYLSVEWSEWKGFDLKLLKFMKVLKNIISIKLSSKGFASDSSFVINNDSLLWLQNLNKLKYFKISSKNFKSQLSTNFLNNFQMNYELSLLDISKLYNPNKSTIVSDIDFSNKFIYNDKNLQIILQKWTTVNNLDYDEWSFKHYGQNSIYTKIVKSAIQNPTLSFNKINIDGNIVNSFIVDGSLIWDVDFDTLNKVKYYVEGDGYFTHNADSHKKYEKISKAHFSQPVKDLYDKKKNGNGANINYQLFFQSLAPGSLLKDVKAKIDSYVEIDNTRYYWKVENKSWLLSYNFKDNRTNHKKIKYFSKDLKHFWTSLENVSDRIIKEYEVSEIPSSSGFYQEKIESYQNYPIAPPKQEDETLLVDGIVVPAVSIMEKGQKIYKWFFDSKGIDASKIHWYSSKNNKAFTNLNAMAISNDFHDFHNYNYIKYTSDIIKDFNSDEKYGLRDIFSESLVKNYIKNKQDIKFEINDQKYGYIIFDGKLFINYEQINKVKYLLVDKSDVDNRSYWKYYTEFPQNIPNNKKLLIVRIPNYRSLPTPLVVPPPNVGNKSGRYIIVNNEQIPFTLSKGNVFWDFSKTNFSINDIKFVDENGNYYTKSLFEFNTDNIPSKLTSVLSNATPATKSDEEKESNLIVNKVNYLNMEKILHHQSIYVDGIVYDRKLFEGNIYWVRSDKPLEVFNTSLIKFAEKIVDGSDTGKYYSNLSTAYSQNPFFPKGIYKVAFSNYLGKVFSENKKSILAPKDSNSEILVVNNGIIDSIKSKRVMDKSTGKYIFEWDYNFKNLIQKINYVIKTPEGKEVYFSSISDIAIKEFKNFSETWSKSKKDNFDVNISDVSRYKFADFDKENKTYDIRTVDLDENKKDPLIISISLASVLLFAILSIVIYQIFKNSKVNRKGKK